MKNLEFTFPKPQFKYTRGSNGATITENLSVFDQ